MVALWQPKLHKLHKTQREALAATTVTTIATKLSEAEKSLITVFPLFIEEKITTKKESKNINNKKE